MTLRLGIAVLTAACAMAQEPVKARPNFFGLVPPPDAQAVARGERLFVASCGFCHGSTAKGGNNGPDLVRSVLVLHDEGTAKELGPVILLGRPQKGMPKFEMTAAQIQDIAAYLLSRSQATIVRGDYKILNVLTGDAAAGRTYFQAHCATCHSPSGDLAGVAGKYDAPALQARFLYPKARQTERSQVRAVVTLANGQTFAGVVRTIDDFSVTMVDSSGQYRSWLLGSGNGIQVVVKDPLEGHERLLKRYTDAEIQNVLAYLETLK